jgi:hypothetical protein
MMRLGSGLVVLGGGGSEQQDQAGDKEHQRSHEHQGLPDAPAARDKDAGVFVHG